MLKIPKPYLLTALILTLSGWSCSQIGQQETLSEAEQLPAEKKKVYQSTGSIEKLDAGLDKVISTDARIEIIAEGFKWAEGPLWVLEKEMLLFADIPPNKIYQWNESEGLQLYLTPSGYTGKKPRGGEPGANGLLLDWENRLILCQHGDRRMARMEAPLDKPEPRFTTLADKYQGKRLNSPNDAVFKSNGELYFTDPPYGLEKNAEDPAKELSFQGVYRLDWDNQVHLLTKELSRPNGIAFSPDEKTLYVANSDPKNPIWMAYELQENGNVASSRIFFDASKLAKTAAGLPDGMKVNRKGIIFATGPGGVLIFNKDGKHLGTIKTGQPTANCAFNEDETMLYITANMYLMRVSLLN
jgi:gluconolactonase